MSGVCGILRLDGRVTHRGTLWVWEKTTSDPRALVRLREAASPDKRFMACHYHPDELTLTLDVGRSLRNVALYFVDGKYVVWKIRGPVRFHVRRTGPRNAVVSGVFVDPPPT